MLFGVWDIDESPFYPSICYFRLKLFALDLYYSRFADASVDTIH